MLVIAIDVFVWCLVGVKMRRGSRDDLALCATTPSRVKRHASVVMLRHSLIEGADTNPADPNASPLTLWTHTSGNYFSLMWKKEIKLATTVCRLPLIQN